MKKIFSILCIGVIWCFLPMLVKASDGMSLEQVKSWYASNGLVGIDSQIEYIYNALPDYNFTNKEYGIIKNPTILDGNEANVVIFKFNQVGERDDYGLTWNDSWYRWYLLYNSSYSNNYAYSKYELAYNFNNNTLVSVGDNSQTTAGTIRSTDFLGSNINADLILTSDVPNINFDNVYYSPLIATPILNPYYTAYNEAGINIPYVPLTFDLSNSSENYYLQIKQKNYTPSVVRVEGANKFNVQARNGFDVHDVYEMQDLIVSSDFSRNDFYNDISDNWTDDLNEFAFSNVEMINGLQTTIGSTADAYFLAQSSKFQQLRNIQTVYGNIIEIWARYFMLDENNNVVVGKWYHWWSLASDSFDEQLPEYVIPYEKAFGTENTTDNNNAPSGAGTINGTGTSSNPNQNYTYVSVVPNYPDYPTIASYNKDNLLVDTITKMVEIKSFFGEFNDFLAVSFVWVPDWIWGLIGIGFGLSILVFFLRML